MSYWTDGKGDDRVLYVTTGYRLISLNAKTGQPTPTFADKGVLDLKVGVMIHKDGKQVQADLEKSEIGLHATPTVVNDMIIVGSSMFEGLGYLYSTNVKGLVRAFDVRHRQTDLALRHDAWSGPAGSRNVGERFLGVDGQHRRVDGYHGRPRGRLGVSAGRNPHD